ncbi:hypothetical protein ALSL_1085 [Aerosticca soli]|uniref:Uncharacterized protein n=1 Tax=Aerosticca soli TaxID=2010829 RepID=A0A2Z6E5E3_9GAMM|nr:hypothetical protein ALSL_1085 [Aerosticca soli]
MTAQRRHQAKQQRAAVAKALAFERTRRALPLRRALSMSVTAIAACMLLHGPSPFLF